MQTDCDGFDIVFGQFFGKTRRTIELFFFSECAANSIITNEPKLLTRAYLTAAAKLGMPAAASAPQDLVHGFDAEISPMIFDEDILHFRRFAKYVAVFWWMICSSSRSANCRLRRVFSAASSFSRAEEVTCCCYLMCQL